MVALVQRVSEASVEVDNEIVGRIGGGLLILLGVHQNDTEEEGSWLARKCARLRIFDNEKGYFDRSLQDIGGEALVVSQFTLYGNVQKGNRPSFTDAAPPDEAEGLYEHFVSALEAELGHPVESGVFGAMMNVQLVNDGPVTLWVER